MTAGMTFRLDNTRGTTVVALLPELNDAPWNEIDRIGSSVLNHVSGSPSPKLLVDLSPLSTMGSAQVALVVRFWKGIKERNGKMIVVNSHPVVRDVLNLAGLDKVWSIAPSREDGLQQLGSGGGGDLAMGGDSPGLIAWAGLGCGLVGALLLAIGYVAKQPVVAGTGCVLGGAAFLCGIVSVVQGRIADRVLAAVALVLSMPVVLSGVVLFATGQLASKLPAVSPSAEAEAVSNDSKEPPVARKVADETGGVEKAAGK